MAFTKITQAEINKSGVSGLPNKPTMGAQKLKEAFDSPGKEVLYPAYNRLIDELQADTGASSLGMTVPEGIEAPGNVQGVVSAIAAKVNGASGEAHTHPNKALLDTYTQTEEDLADAVSKKHEHSNKALLDTYNQTNADITDAIEKKHEHSNYELLESYTQTNANLTDAVAKKHRHENMALLETYTQEDIDIADAVDKKHSHANKTVIDKFSEVDGKPQYDGKPIGGGGSGTDVTWSQYVTSGTKIASIEIDGTPTDVYAPTGGGGGGTSSYPSLDDLPSLNGKQIIGSHNADYYGLANATTVTQLASDLEDKADKSTTLAGYGITNAYTKANVDSKLSAKVNEPDIEGEDGYALLTDGNGGRTWGKVASDVQIDSSTIVKNTSNKLSVPIDNDTIVVDPSDNKVKVSSDITEKLSEIDNKVNKTDAEINVRTVKRIANKFTERLEFTISANDTEYPKWQNVDDPSQLVPIGDASDPNMIVAKELYEASGEHIEFSFLFDSSCNQPIYLGGYQYISDIGDGQNGAIAIKLGNSPDTDINVAIDITHIKEVIDNG